MSAIDVTRANRNAAQMNDIAKAANTQLGSYAALAKAFIEFNKQAKENSKTAAKASGSVSALNTKIYQGIATQTALLKQILTAIKEVSVGTGTGTKTVLSANGQQKEMAEEVKKNNQVKGTVSGKIKLAPETIKELTTSTSTATTKAMVAATNKVERAKRTQALAQSFTQKKEKEVVPQKTIESKPREGLFSSIKRAMPLLLSGLKKIFFALLNPVSLVAAFIARFLPYLILIGAFLYGVWQGIKDNIGKILESALQLISDGWESIKPVILEGLSLLWDKVLWPLIDKVTDVLAEWMFKGYEAFCKWWDMFKEVVSFGIDWIKDGFANWWNMLKEIVCFALDWIKGVFGGAIDWVVDTFVGIRDTVIGWFTSIGNSIKGFFGGIKDKVANSWLGKKLGLGSDATPSNTNINTTNNNTTTDNGEAVKAMTKNISAPMNQMSRLIENQNLLLKKMEMTPREQQANFAAGMTPVNGNITVVPADNIKSTLIQQTSTINSMQTNNNKEIANAFNAGVDRLVTTMNNNYQRSLVDKQATVALEG